MKGTTKTIVKRKTLSTKKGFISMDRSHVVFVIISKDHKAKKLHKPIIPRERELYNIYVYSEVTLKLVKFWLSINIKN